jgi:hypothetical protein
MGDLIPTKNRGSEEGTPLVLSSS